MILKFHDIVAVVGRGDLLRDEADRAEALEAELERFGGQWDESSRRDQRRKLQDRRAQWLQYHLDQAATIAQFAEERIAHHRRCAPWIQRRAKMPACTVCSHPKRNEINRALINNSGSGREIAGRFDLKKSSVDRHRRNHLRPHLAQLIAEDPELAELNPLAEIKALYYRVRHLLDKAEDANDLPAFKAFHGEARKDLELLAKLLGDVSDTFEQHNYVSHHHHHPTREQQFEKLFKDIEQIRRENSS